MSMTSPVWSPRYASFSSENKSEPPVSAGERRAMRAPKTSTEQLLPAIRALPDELRESGLGADVTIRLDGWRRTVRLDRACAVAPISLSSDSDATVGQVADSGGPLRTGTCKWPTPCQGISRCLFARDSQAVMLPLVDVARIGDGRSASVARNPVDLRIELPHSHFFSQEGQHGTTQRG